MKRIILIAITLCLLTSLTACSCGGCKTAPPTPEASYFLMDYKQNGVANVEETAIYRVNYTKNGVEGSNGITANMSDGEFKTVLTRVSVSELNLPATVQINSEYCYKLQSFYSLSGSYTLNSKVAPVNDVITSTVWFLGEKDNVKPLKMEKRVKCTTVYADYKTNGTMPLSFIDYDFSYTIDYTTKNAVIDYTDNSTDQNFKLQDKTIKKYFSNTFCENELLIFYPRLFKLNSSFSTTIKTITVDGKTSLGMKVSAYNKNYQFNKGETGSIDYSIGGKDLTVKCDVVQYNSTGEYSGAPLSVFCASVSDNNGFFRAPVRIEKYVTLVGTLEYSLKSFVHNEG